MSQHIADRLHTPGRKRMLALDGGGTRGIVTIAFLKQIQRTLQTKLGRGDDFVLSDYFDLIGGTSVGSIIATLLALGWRAERIEKTFRDWSPEIFKERWISDPTKTKPRFEAYGLSAKIKTVVDGETLETDKLKTGLCIVTKRADTGSPWVLVNNPAARYWDRRGVRIGNKDYTLFELIRASTAAPTYFSPHDIATHHDSTKNRHQTTTGRFVDGAISPYNNPALIMFMLAGLRGYHLGGANADKSDGIPWTLGADNLLLISVGTGSHATKTSKKAWVSKDGREAIEALTGIIADGSALGLTLLQWMGKSGFNWHIDRELGDQSTDTMTAPDMLTFQRYDVELDEDWLLGRHRTGVKPGPKLRDLLKSHGLDDETALRSRLAKLRELIGVDQMSDLHDFAEAAATDQVSTGADVCPRQHAPSARSQPITPRWRRPQSNH